MSELIERQEQVRDFLDDCVAMVEALRCMEDKGAEAIDTAGVTLLTEVFDRCFPGVEWKSVTVDGAVICQIKEAEYRGFRFDAVRDEAI